MRAAALLVAALAFGQAASEEIRPPISPTWAVDPQDPGPNLPSVGRSLFDHLFAREGVPFPFQSLLARIEEHSSLKKVLIPLGRSLQRNAADPEFFRYPRAVAAVDGDGIFKDRLYLGYHEKAAVLEVISYNEAAGRFEFQLVLDYRPGGAARLVYANRAVCTACHQGGGPLFSRQVWDETNANPEIARLLAAEKRDFYGFPIALGVEVPAAIDAATDRANRIAVYQLLWREGCGSEACRAAAFLAALQYRLSGGLSGGLHEGMGGELRNAWRWPHGLAIPDPDIPNRDPLASHRSTPAVASVPATLGPEESRRLGGLVLRSHVPAAFEPLNPRPPLEIWTKETGPERLIAGLAGFLTDEDARRLDAALFSRGKAGEKQTFPCEVSIQPRSTGQRAGQRVKLRCSDALEGRIFLEGSQVAGGTIERLGAMRDLEVVEGKSDPNGLEIKVVQKLSGLHARRADGNAVESLRISYSGEATVAFLDDFSALNTDLPGDVFSSAPFRRAAVMGALFRKLGLESDDCCLADASLPPPVLETGETVADFSEPAVRALYQYCGRCHATPEVSPPNFLHGDADRVRANLARCAERIFYRLDLWRLPVTERSKTPMPPVHALPALGLTPGDPRLDQLRQHAAGLLRKETGREPRLADLEARGYESLRSCLP